VKVGRVILAPMAESTAQAALDRIEVDADFAQRVRDAGSSEASLAVLAAEGFDVTSDEMRDATVERFGGQLTPEQLDALSAGITDKDVWTGFGIVAGATVVLSAAAAAV